MNMKQWMKDVIAAPRKKAMPILSFPSAELLGCDVRSLVSDSEMQAEGIRRIAGRLDMLAAVSLMDLSVEAEAFGAQVRFSDSEVPAVTGALVTSRKEAEELKVPGVDAARCPVYTEAIRKVCRTVTDRPVFAGVIGPFSLAGRLMDVSEAMVNCYVDPEMVHIVLGKAAQFLTAYIGRYKEAGANGVIMAEPLAGLLSPELAREFSADYVRQIVENVQDEEFMVIYHNCGDNVLQMTDSIAQTKAAAFHFGNSISMRDMLEALPGDRLVMGNLDPTGQIRNGTPQSVKEQTRRIMEECCGYRNFVISSGCDIPPGSRWENIDAFFEAVKEFYDEA